MAIRSKLGFLLLFLLTPFFLCSQTKTSKLDLQIEVDSKLSGSFHPEGRLFIFLNTDPKSEPRLMTWPSEGNHIFAKNYASLKPGASWRIRDWKDWHHTAGFSPDSIPAGTYNLQVLWDQDLAFGGPSNPGNLFSTKQEINISGKEPVIVKLSEVIPAAHVENHSLVREIDFISDTLSRWWKKPFHLSASILLPASYGTDSGKAFPIRYNVAGYGGRFTRVNRIAGNKEFMNWWESSEAPPVINVFLDGYGPLGDCYQMDSDNSGPYGYALIHELIPLIEKKYRGTDEPSTRFVDGCSTGGWVSLALQVYYPDTFNGVYSYSPDAVEFENYQLINIYKDQNAFVNEHGYPRPVWRDRDGEPYMSLKDFIEYENILGSSDSYLNSGGQFSAHTALYSPKGKNGLPAPLFDPQTGVIDHGVAKDWEKYDMKIYMKDHWTSLGPKLQGKLFIWMGDMDNFYLNLGTRALDDWLKTTTNPVSDAKIVFSPREGHCQEYSNKTVLIQIADRLKEMDKK